MLDLLVAGTAACAGEQLFPDLVSNLAAAMGTTYALVAEPTAGGRVRSLALWKATELAPSIEWDFAATACADVAGGRLCQHPGGLRQMLSANHAVPGIEIDSYLGAPLVDFDGQHLGYLCVMDARPMAEDPSKLAVFRIFAARAAAELARRRLQRTLGESEERFRDLFDEAPIAYVHEGLDSRFIRANRTAMRTLGITPEEVVGTVGKSFIPDTPEAQGRLQEALESIGRGTDTSGVVLELRRKDNGKPLWLQWWSRPDRSGTYTRTMFIDITERVLLEQEQARLHAQNRYLQEEIKLAHNFEEIVGRSPALLDVLEDVKRVAPTDASVLITGETGTGKELIARAIHSNSKRHDKPLIKLNCAALPNNLVESELFGHEKGAFTGAIAQRVGRFELAHGGTIFLDEIGEVPLDVQVKLLRVIQEHEIERVGGNTPLACDVRIIAATNRDLGKAIRAGHFREDLFYRLNVFPIHLPPLRERPGDIRLLVQFFLAKFCARLGKRIDAVTPASLARFEAYAWPGNVRELENFVERSVILATSEVLDATPEPAAHFSVPERSRARSTPRSEPLSLPSTLEAVGRGHILAILERTGWVIEGPAGAAQALGLHPNTLRSRMKKLGIARPTS